MPFAYLYPQNKILKQNRTEQNRKTQNKQDTTEQKRQNIHKNSSKANFLYTILLFRFRLEIWISEKLLHLQHDPL